MRVPRNKRMAALTKLGHRYPQEFRQLYLAELSDRGLTGRPNGRVDRGGR